MYIDSPCSVRHYNKVSLDMEAILLKIFKKKCWNQNIVGSLVVISFSKQFLDSTILHADYIPWFSYAPEITVRNVSLVRLLFLTLFPMSFICH